MSDETMGTCPIPGNCPDNYGGLPACAALAVPFVPFQQQNAEMYNQNDALAQGTLFPGLNLPFHLKMQGAPVPMNASTELQALEFVVLELGHYLDTHSSDAEAYELFQQYNAMLTSARTAYEKKHGPLTRCNATTADTYTWLQDPWPWHYQKDEV